MSQAYSNPKRASDPHALPDVEVFHVDSVSAAEQTTESNPFDVGWYWWSCFPDCLPDGDPIGPFATEAEALADAQEGCDDDDDETESGED